MGHAMTSTPNKGGRPPVADKRRVRGVRFNDAEWAWALVGAAAEGVPVAEFVRRAVVAAMDAMPRES